LVAHHATGLLHVARREHLVLAGQPPAELVQDALLIVDDEDLLEAHAPSLEHRTGGWSTRGPTAPVAASRRARGSGVARASGHAHGEHGALARPAARIDGAAVSFHDAAA